MKYEVVNTGQKEYLVFQSPTYGTQITRVDPGMGEKLDGYNLRVVKLANGFYVNHAESREKTSVPLGHILLGRPPDGYHVDHINRDPMDNRLCNLRILSAKENHQNKIGRGYSFYPSLPRPYRARIGVNGKPKWLGYFATAREARTAYLEAKRRYHPSCTLPDR